MEKQMYQCCFCENDITSNKLDVTGIVIITNWDKGKDLQQEQQLFCHIECLKNKLSKNVLPYLKDTVE
ncbi:MAG: hypothetical protein ACOX8S_12265 [Christensenellales bacterium]